MPFMSRPDRAGLQCSKTCPAVASNKRRSFGLPRAEVYRRRMRVVPYGLDHEQFTRLWEKQKGLCAICSVELKHGGRFADSTHVVHNTATGRSAARRVGKEGVSTR